MADEPTTKTLYCIRHGESTFNEWRKQSIWNFSWIWVRDPMIIDAPLSAKGEQQAQQLHQTIKSKKLDERVEVIITSPLTRSIQTMVGGFQDASIPILLTHSLLFAFVNLEVVEPSCREMLDTACDIGRQPEELAASFADLNVDFRALEQCWWLPPHKRPADTKSSSSSIPKTHEQVLPLRESVADVDVRIKALLAKLNELPEKHIAIVGHSAFFKRMLGMNRKLHNCELYKVPFAEVASRYGIHTDA